MKKIIGFVKKHLVLFCILVSIVLALLFAFVARSLNTYSDTDIKDIDNTESDLKSYDKKDSMYNRYWVSVSGGNSVKDKYNDISSSNLDVLYFTKNGTFLYYMIEKTNITNNGSTTSSINCLTKMSYTYTIDDYVLKYKSSNSDDVAEVNILYDSDYDTFMFGNVKYIDIGADYSNIDCTFDGTNKEEVESRLKEREKERNNSIKDNDDSDVINNSTVKEEVTLSAQVYEETEIDSATLMVSTNEEGCTYDVYLNDKKIASGGKLSIGTDGYDNETLIKNMSLGNNNIKINLIKNGKVLKSATKKYYVDSSKIPSPRLDISDQYNTYDSSMDLTIWSDDNGCSGSKCKLELYVNGKKQSSIDSYRAKLNIGNNTFKLELKNLYGKKACKIVTIKRFEYNENVDFTDLGNISIKSC